MKAREQRSGKVFEHRYTHANLNLKNNPTQDLSQLRKTIHLVGKMYFNGIRSKFSKER